MLSYSHRAALLLLATASAAQGAVAQPAHGARHHLGSVHFEISCSPQAQADFDRALALLHHMTYPQARQGFQAIITREPECAMAYWGLAMTLFQPLWPTRPSAEDLRRGLAVTQKARAIKPATQRETLFIDAATAFFGEPASLTYWERIARRERASARAYENLPKDHEAAAFYALAHLATAPSDRVALSHSERAAQLLLEIYERNPEHPGAMHYLVHANDVPGREHQLLPIVRKYETVAPRNPHALHMPTHIYTRLGDWEGVIRGNLRAAEAALEHPAGDRGQWVWDEFPHAVEYLVYAYLQQGADSKAAEQIERLDNTRNIEPSFKTAFHLASTRARYALERGQWREARALPVRAPASLDWDRFAWPESVSWFARGVGASRSGQSAEAQSAAKRLAELELSMNRAGETLFARSIKVLLLATEAWIQNASGERDRAVQLMRQAADLEAATPKHAVTPGPTLPSAEMLGDLLLEHGRHAEAHAAYVESLKLYPRRFNSVLGAARATRAAGDNTTAGAFYAELTKIAEKGARPAALAEAREALRAR